MTKATPSIGMYVGIFSVLILLTGATVAVAFVDLGAMNVVVALTIAVTKALLVALYFMHLRYSGSLNWLFAAAGVLWLVFLMGLTLSDVATRAWLGAPSLSQF